MSNKCNWNGFAACFNKVTHFYATSPGYKESHFCYCDVHYEDLTAWIHNHNLIEITEEEYIIEEVLKK
jgi:hypothetical protein